MRFLSCSLKNFASYGDAESTLDLSQTGIRLVSGKNGTGKSSVFSSVIWCLYGRSLVSVDEVINRYTKKNCKVGVVFESQGQKYTVYRYRKHDTHGNNLYLFKDDKNISLKNVTDTQQLIQDIIQIPYQAMVSSFIFSSETYSSFLRSKNADRLKIVESVLFLKEITSYYEVARKKLKEIEAKRTEQAHEEDKVDTAIETINKNLEEYNTRTKSTLLNLKNKKDDAERKIKELEKEFDEISKLNLQEELKKIEEYERDERFNNDINIEISHLSIRNSSPDELKDKLTDLENELVGFKQINVQKEFELLEMIQKIKNTNLAFENEIKVLSAGLITTNHDAELRKLSLEKEKIIKEFEVIHSKQCPLCGHDLGEEKHKEIFSTKQNRLTEIDKEIDAIIKAQTDEANKNLKIKEKITSLKEQIAQVPHSEYDNEFLHNLNAKITDTDKAITDLRYRIENSSEDSKRIEALKKKLKVLLNPIYTRENLESFSTIQDQIETLKKNVEAVNEQAKTVYDKKYVESFKEKLKKLKEYKEKVSNILKEIDDEKRYFSVLTDIFSNKENSFKKYFIDRIISTFNTNINFYLPLFFDTPLEINFDKELNETISFDGYEVPFDSFSSGQKTRIDLAIAISLFMLVKTFFSTSVNIIVFDEILDQNLDATGVNAVISILENMAQETGVLVISHRDEYKERFSTQIEIKVKDKCSYIEER